MTKPDFDFEDVTMEVVLEGDTSHDALVRWQKRYPEYRDRLAGFFATWSVQRDLAERTDVADVEIDEERIVQKGVEYSLELMRRQGRLTPPAPVELPEPFDQLVLTAIYLLHGKADAVRISDKVTEMSGRDVMVGSMFVTLDRLELKGLVSGVDADPAHEPDGRVRRYFTVTLAGERVLALAKERSTAVAGFLGDLA